MSRAGWLAVVLVCIWPAGGVALASGACHKKDLERIGHELKGTILDYTHNHGADNRIWSPALGAYRDLYVYLPPGYDPHQFYPFMMWLHGFAQDEQSFLTEVVRPLDQAMSSGEMPRMIVAVPDGSLEGSPCLITAGSFFINSQAGRFEDFIMQDVWNFMMTNFPLRPEREAHLLAGVSMGGGGAYNLAIKYRDRVKLVAGIFPPLNFRWQDCHGHYFGNFDPCCWDWRTDYSRKREVVGRFYGVIAVRMRRVIGPVYGMGPDTWMSVSRENPIELIDRLDLREGELCMYIGYGGKDQFNVDAQVESFLYRARQRGLTVTVGYDPNGKHDLATAMRLMPGMLAWLRGVMEPFSPPCGEVTVPHPQGADLEKNPGPPTPGGE